MGRVLKNNLILCQIILSQEELIEFRNKEDPTGLGLFIFRNICQSCAKTNLESKRYGGSEMEESDHLPSHWS